MKKHLLGIFMLVLTFTVSFLASPIRFSSIFVGAGEHGGFTAFESTDFVRLSSTTERFETVDETNIAFEEHKNQFSRYIYNQTNLEITDDRLVISFNSELIKEGFCVIRKQDYKLYEICSSSLWHIREFEKQKFTKD